VTPAFWLAFAALCVVQGALVLVPTRPARTQGVQPIGLLVPAGLLVLGVLLVRGVSDGARALTDLFTFGTPVAAGVCGYLAGWRRASAAALVAAEGSTPGASSLLGGGRHAPKPPRVQRDPAPLDESRHVGHRHTCRQAGFSLG
jgi:hypothetical protein